MSATTNGSGAVAPLSRAGQPSARTKAAAATASDHFHPWWAEAAVAQLSPEQLAMVREHIERVLQLDEAPIHG
jgi:hypothetical protein